MGFESAFSDERNRGIINLYIKGERRMLDHYAYSELERSHPALKAMLEDLRHSDPLSDLEMEIQYFEGLKKAHTGSPDHPQTILITQYDKVMPLQKTTYLLTLDVINSFASNKGQDPLKVAQESWGDVKRRIFPSLEDAMNYELKIITLDTMAIESMRPVAEAMERMGFPSKQDISALKRYHLRGYITIYRNLYRTSP